MKKLLLLALTLSLPLAQSVRADSNRDRANRRKHQPETEAAAPTRQARTTARPSLRRAGPQTQSRVAPVQQVSNRNLSHGRVTPGVEMRNRNVDRGNTGGNVGINRNRGNRNFDRNSFNVARTRVIHTHHNRGWWRSHFNTTFVLFGGGYYYWDAGYWYPAYGYDPYYNTYAYNEPIYGYDNLQPGQILENVQLALRDLGYYHGPIDGLIGPQTRNALARFQRDNGLVETAAVDEPTLVTLGLA